MNLPKDFWFWWIMLNFVFLVINLFSLSLFGTICSAIGTASAVWCWNEAK
jgi:hypothetical protein